MWVSLNIFFYLCTFSSIFLNSEAESSQKPPNGPIIIGGEKTNIENYPYLVSVQDIFRRHLCTGTLIDRKHVLSSATCLNAAIVIRGGTDKLNSPMGWTRLIIDTYIHYRYAFPVLDSNLAVFVLNESIPFHGGLPKVFPMLPKYSTFISQKSGKILGWGRRALYNTREVALKVLDVSILDDQECLKYLEPYGMQMTMKMFCAKDESGNMDSYEGDSGVPLLIDDTIYGILTWRRILGNVAVFTKVPINVNFINNALKDEKIYS